MNEANAASSDPLIGTRIDGRYTIRGVLGHGGMGVVYDGVHDELGRPVAIKVLNTAWAADRTAVERFLREARTASSFTHGNIVDVSDLGRLPDGRPYLVMPKITGTDLTTLLLEMGPQPAKRVADLLGGVASALDLIHAKGYVHRDIKPENLMYVVRDDGSETVMLLDFGIAKLVMSTEPRLTGQGAVFGTPHFMPPEAWGGGATDASGDVYALATVVFELITGELPFESENVMQLLTMKIGRDAPSLASVTGREFPHELETVMARALARKPAHRFGAATEFVNALKGATSHAPVSWRPGVLRSSLHSGQHMVERQHTSSIHVQDHAYSAEQEELDEGYEEIGYADDETTRDTQRSLPGRRTLEQHAAWAGADLDEFHTPYRVTPRPQYRRNPWPGYLALLAVAGALVALAIRVAAPAAPNTARNAATVAPTPAPPNAAANPAAPSVTQNMTPTTATGSAEPVAAAPSAAPSAEPAAAAVPANVETRPAVPIAAAPPPAAAPSEPVAATPAVAPPAPRARASEPPPQAKAPRASAPALAPPEPFAPEAEEPAAPAATSEVLIVKQDTSEPPPEAPQHDSARAKQLTQQATASLLRGEVGRAVELLTQATDADPTQPAAWRTLGVALERAGSAPSAIEAYRHYLKLAPSGAQAEMVRERMQALEK